MQLTYRGVNYDYTPRGAGAVREAAVFRALRPAYNLHYRGTVYTVDPNVEPSLPVIQQTAQLRYRGVAYALNGWVQSSTITAKQTHLKAKVAAHQDFNAVHRSNLNTNLQHRLQVAREKGDQNLINLLERESQQIA